MERGGGRRRRGGGSRVMADDSFVYTVLCLLFAACRSGTLTLSRKARVTMASHPLIQSLCKPLL